MAIQKTKKGFTIIEVVLVLAIAGLIFLMVFVALPALQRSQRDTRRREDLARMNNAVVQYQTNNSSKAKNLPASGQWKRLADDDYTFPANCSSNSACRFVRDYMNSAEDVDNNENTFLDPDGIPYSLTITDYLTNNATFSATGLKVVNSSASAKEYEIDPTVVSFDDRMVYLVPGGKCSNEYVTESTVRHFAILYRLEGSGVLCLDDQ